MAKPQPTYIAGAPKLPDGYFYIIVKHQPFDRLQIREYRNILWLHWTHVVRETMIYRDCRPDGAELRAANRVYDYAGFNNV